MDMRWSLLTNDVAMRDAGSSTKGKLGASRQSFAWSAPKHLTGVAAGMLRTESACRQRCQEDGRRIT